VTAFVSRKPALHLQRLLSAAKLKFKIYFSALDLQQLSSAAKLKKKS